MDKVELRRHKEIGAKREQIYEAMSFLWMELNGDIPELNDMLKQKNLPINVHETLKDISKKKLSVFLEFWKEYYLPTLLASTK